MSKLRRTRGGPAPEPTSTSGGARAGEPRASAGNDAAQHDMKAQGAGEEQEVGDIWGFLSQEISWSALNPLSWFDRDDASDVDEEIVAPEEINGPSRDHDEEHDLDEHVVEEVVEVIEAAEEAEELAAPDLAMRPESVRANQYGGLIQLGGGDIDVKSGPGADASVKSTVPDGTACRVTKVENGFIEVAFRAGSKEEKGWVNVALFSDQPRLFHDESDKSLMEDLTWTLAEGDQSMPEGADGRSVAQGGLADCYFVAAANAVGMANPEFLRESIQYDASSGIYRCRFFEEAGWDPQTRRAGTREVWIEVDGYLPTKGKSQDAAYADANDSTKWGAIYEKAYAKWKGGFQAMGDGGLGSQAMEEMTGNPATYKNTSQLSEDEVVPFFEKAKEAGLAIYTGSNSTGQVDVQTPLTKSGDNSYSGTVKQSHEWNHLEPGTVRVEDLSGNVASAKDTGREGDKKAGFRGADVKEGEVDYKPNRISLTYNQGKAPEAADQLQVSGEFKGMINAPKQVIGWHGYSFDKVVDGGLIQLYNPWGSWQPKPLTPAEYLACYSSLSTCQVPQAKGEA